MHVEIQILHLYVEARALSNHIPSSPAGPFRGRTIEFGKRDPVSTLEAIRT